MAAEEIQRLRRQKGWTQQHLADQLEALGVPLDRSAVARIESATRNVTLDEVFALAAALTVSPAALMIPRSAQQLQVAPAEAAATEIVESWLRRSMFYQPTAPYPDTAAWYAARATNERTFNESRRDDEDQAMRAIPELRPLVLLTDEALRFACRFVTRPSDGQADELGSLLEVLEEIRRAAAAAGGSIASLARQMSPELQRRVLDSKQAAADWTAREGDDQ